MARLRTSLLSAVLIGVVILVAGMSFTLPRSATHTASVSPAYTLSVPPVPVSVSVSVPASVSVSVPVAPPPAADCSRSAPPGNRSCSALFELRTHASIGQRAESLKSKLELWKDKGKQFDEDKVRGRERLASCLATHIAVYESMDDEQRRLCRSSQVGDSKGVRRRVFDTFMISDEWPLVLLRLNELSVAVDHFIIIESNETFTSKAKGLFSQMFPYIWKPFAQQVHFARCEYQSRVHPKWLNDPWTREHATRNCGQIGVDALGASADDVVYMSDTDELPHPKALWAMGHCSESVLFHPSTPAPQLFVSAEPRRPIPTSDYFTVSTCGPSFVGSHKWADASPSHNNLCLGAFTSARAVREMGLQRTRELVHSALQIRPAVWHCRYCFLGDVSMVKRKLEAYSEQSFAKIWKDKPKIMESVVRNCSGWELRPEDKRCNLFTDVPNGVPRFVWENRKGLYKGFVYDPEDPNAQMN